MKKLLLTIGVLGMLGSTPQSHAVPFTLTAITGAAGLFAAAVGKSMYTVGDLSKEVSNVAALLTGGVSMAVAVPLFQGLAHLGCITTEWPWQLFYAGVSATAVAGLVKLSMDPVLKGYSRDLKRTGSDLMHASGCIALLSAALCLAHINGY